MSQADVKLIPLGGLGEIGMNCFVIQEGGKQLIIDCGVTFPHDDLGVDVIHPDFEWMGQNPSDSRALLITHGHEDHIGAIPYLLKQYPMPVWAPPHALALIEERLSEHHLLGAVELHQLAVDQVHQIAGFQVETLSVTHSTADAVALAITTQVGTIVHTGDFKIDPHAPSGAINEKRFVALGDAGVRLLLSDSTNIDSPGRAGTESTPRTVLTRLISEASQAVVVALFSSNIDRVRTVLEAAREANRKVVLLGRSIQKHTAVAEDLGYLSDVDDVVIEAKMAQKIQRHKLVYLATGSQGETNAALSALAQHRHPLCRLEPGDEVIFSSRIIPGRELSVFALSDAFERMGVVVRHAKNTQGLHVSGHACRDELTEMLHWTRPAAFVPVHGTYHHLTAHAALARSLGVPDVKVIENGDVLVLNQAGLHKDARVPSGRVSRQSAVVITSEALDSRRALARRGVVSVSLCLSGKRPQKAQSVVRLLGVCGSDDVKKQEKSLALDVDQTVASVLVSGHVQSASVLEDAVRRSVNRWFVQSGRPKPTVMFLPQDMAL